MAYFTIKQCSIFYSFPMDVKEQRKLDVFLTVLESSGVGPIIASSVFGDGPNVGKKPYDPYRVFAFIVLAFSLKKMTLRDIEDFGRNPHEDTEIHTVRRSIRNHEGRHVESPFQKNGDPEGGAGDDAVRLWVQCQKAVQFHKWQYECTGEI